MKKFKIYKITCLDNGMIYVGRTERTLQERFQEHSWNKKSYLGRAMRAHGKDRLTIELLAECDDFDEANEELVEAGVIELSEDDLDQAAGGLSPTHHGIYEIPDPIQIGKYFS